MTGPVTGSAAGLGYEFVGPPGAPHLVLGSSLGTTRALWDAQLPALASSYRVLRFDHLGHGDSAVPAGPYRIELLGDRLLRLLDAAGVRRAAYCGISLGGMLGLWLAAHHPDRVDRLAVISASAYLPPAAGWRERAREVRAHGTAAIVERVLGRWFTPGFGSSHPDTVAHLAAALAGTPPEGYAGCCEAIADLDLRPVLARIRARTLVVAGAEDPATPPGHAAYLAEAIPDAHLSIIAGAAHLPNVERAATVEDLLLAHLGTGTEER